LPGLRYVRIGIDATTVLRSATQRKKVGIARAVSSVTDSPESLERSDPYTVSMPIELSGRVGFSNGLNYGHPTYYHEIRDVR